MIDITGSCDRCKQRISDGEEVVLEYTGPTKVINNLTCLDLARSKIKVSHSKCQKLVIVELESKTAAAARKEARQKYPGGGSLKGYADGVCVYITTIRPRGNRAPVASAIRNHSARPTSFTFEP